MVRLGDATTPTAADVHKNEMWVKGIVAIHPQRIPSVYYLADALLVLDKDVFKGKLLLPYGPLTTKQDLIEQTMLNKCI